MKDFIKNWKNEGLTEHEQLYLRTYKSESIRNKRIGYIFYPFVILAALVPPLSLFFTIPMAIALRKNPDFRLGRDVALILLDAFIPFFSGFVAFVSIKVLQNRQRNIHMLSTCDLGWQPIYIKITKNKINKINPEYRPVDRAKPKKVVIGREGETYVFLDSGRLARHEKYLKYEKILVKMNKTYSPKAYQKEREILEKKLTRAPAFFAREYKRSNEIVREIEKRYQPKIG